MARFGTAAPPGASPAASCSIRSSHVVDIRLAEARDAEAVRTIYNLEVTTATSTFDLVPRSLAQQEQW